MFLTRSDVGIAVRAAAESPDRALLLGIPVRRLSLLARTHAAGLSGIGAACRLQTDAPGTSYAVVEARGASGGTWDLFRFPGVRSDSDMFTLSYRFRPWTRARAIAGGDEILRYVRETAAA